MKILASIQECYMGKRLQTLWGSALYMLFLNSKYHYSSKNNVHLALNCLKSKICSVQFWITARKSPKRTEYDVWYKSLGLVGNVVWHLYCYPLQSWISQLSSNIMHFFWAWKILNQMTLKRHLFNCHLASLSSSNLNSSSILMVGNLWTTRARNQCFIPSQNLQTQLSKSTKQ